MLSESLAGLRAGTQQPECLFNAFCEVTMHSV